MLDAAAGCCWDDVRLSGDPEMSGISGPSGDSRMLSDPMMGSEMSDVIQAGPVPGVCRPGYQGVSWGTL